MSKYFSIVKLLFKSKRRWCFSGHDYFTIDGVRRAVDEFAASVAATVSTMPTDAWYWIK